MDRHDSSGTKASVFIIMVGIIIIFIIGGMVIRGELPLMMDTVKGWIH